MKVEYLQTQYQSPLGTLALFSDDSGLTGVYFPEHYPPPREQNFVQGENEHTERAKVALEDYFRTGTFAELPPFSFPWGTELQRAVWARLGEIARGETMTYGALAAKVGRPKAVRAIGGAVGRNPISILNPCHRVIGSSGKLTGFAGGLERKKWLLEHEQTQLSLRF